MVENHKRRRSRNYATGGPQVSQDPVFCTFVGQRYGLRSARTKYFCTFVGSVIIAQIKVMHVDRRDEEVQTRYLKRNDMRKTGAITFGWPATEDLAWHDNHNKDQPCDNTANNRVRSLRKQINRATKVYKEKVTKRHKNYDIFHIGDTVLIETSRSKHKKHCRMHIVPGKILKTRSGHHYFVEWKAANGSQQKKWTSVTELSKLRSREKKSATENKSGYRNKYYIPLTHTDALFSGTDFFCATRSRWRQ